MNKIYDLGHTQIAVIWQEILTPGGDAASNKAVLFLPGWPLKEPVETLRRVGEQIARSSQMRTYVVYTKNQQIVPNSSYPEAKAVCEFLAEMHLTQITLVGYSQGGIKAIDTIVLLQQAANLDICVEGLILINSAGLNEVNAWKFVVTQVVDLTLKTWLAILEESLSKPSLREKLAALKENVALEMRGSRDFLGAVWKEVRPSLRGFFTRLREEIDETISRSPYLDRIEVPIVLVQGAKDHSFDTENLRTRPGRQSAHDDSRGATSKGSFSSSKDNRRQIFAVNLFPHSPYVRAVRAQKFGTHLLPVFRPKGVAQASFYLLQRFRRRAETSVR